MEQKDKIGEQPDLATTLTAGADVENESVVEDLGSPYGKFKDAKSLVNAYNSLQVEFTKKCQQLSALEKINKNDNVQTPFFEKDGWQASLDDFFEKNPKAKEFSKEIANEIVDDKELQQSKSPLDIAYARVLEKNYSSLLDKVDNNNYIESKISSGTKQKIVNDYLKDVKKSPFLMSGFGGNVVASNITKPTTVYEAGELAKNLFK